ncbi:unnamed protein product [Sphagnum jensenii]
MAGDNAVRALLQKLTHGAHAPYWWVYQGVIDDPYGEFLVDENKSLQKIPFTEDTNQRNIGPRHPYLKHVNIAYDFASAGLLDLIIHKKVEKLKSICLHYAIATQWLIPAMFRGESASSQEPAFNGNKAAKKGYKSHQATKVHPSWARQAADDSNFKTTVGNLDAEFIKELKPLVGLQSNGSQTEPYLAHLAQGLQAVEQAA